MAKFNNARYFVPDNLRVSEAELLKIDDYDASHGRAGRGRHAEYPTALIPLELADGIAVSSGSNTDSIVWVAPFPCEIIAFEAGVVSSAGSASTFDLLHEPEGSTPGFTSILDAAVDVHAVAGVMATDAVTDGSEGLAKGDKVKGNFASVGGAVAGGKARLWVRRL